MARNYGWLGGCFACCLALSFTTPARAAGVEHADVSHRDGLYSLNLSMRVKADPDTVYRLITDYDNLDRLSRVIVDSRLLTDNPARRLMVARTCILFFCFTARMTEDVVESGDGILALIDPEHSDFSYGRTQWRVLPANGEYARLMLDGELRPAFWIPPVIGPWLMKQKLLHEAREAVLTVESLAGDA